MLKFSLLGYGHIGKVHRQAIEETIGAELISIIDMNLQDEDLDVKTYTTLESFLTEDTETDVVIIATPNGLHREHAVRCLNAGKHVLIEKPMALTTDRAQEILTVAESKGLRVFSSMQLRFSPPVSYVKQLLENNCLGEIYMVNIQCYWNRNKNYYKTREWHGTNEMDGGVLFTQFSHFIDIVNYWFDEVTCTNSSFYNFNHQGITEFADSGKLDFKANEAAGNMIFTTSTYETNYESSIVIIAEKGTLKIGDQYLNELKYSNLKNVVCSEKNLSTTVKNFHPKAIAEIVEAIAENRSSVLDGHHAIRLVQFIEESYNLAEIKQD
ncbi:Gfo/Idh/MocA family protein [Moheibacter sediminis]|uniref:Predicted dehydrogenase n=1 Tax=Moheibacter sediminis TaxID=1434700 RepID=A0A1W1Y628_9FLAO|nr:Gfo/Idh/MocA family oxidoreductase [Moheibacter sediminis]SMC31660.1 Predicted dehydrogenase [Moheibacter sediminis]